MIELTELEMRILAELEEAGEENVAAMINTVMHPMGGNAEIDEFKRSLERLIGADLVLMATSVDGTGRLVDLAKSQSSNAIKNIEEWLIFDSASCRWKDGRRTGPPYGRSFPYIVNTPLGKRRGRELISEQGWEWYRRT